MGRILTVKEGHLGWLIFDNPQKRNAINYQMWQRIPEALEELNNDEDIRVIIIRGAGEKAFTAGADISEFKTLRNSSKTSDGYNKVTKAAYQGIKYSPKPVVAMIQGFCIGGGLGIALQSDLRISSDEAIFGIPAVKRGIAYGYDGISDLVDIVGPAIAKEVFFTGRNYEANLALKMGLIHHMVEKEALEDFVRDYCLEIASNAPLSIRSIKFAINEYLKDPQERDMAKIEKEMARCFDSWDYQEGSRAFLEKRNPRFLGK